MRRWWKTMSVLAVSVLGFGSWLSSASAQFPPPGGGMGMPPTGFGGGAPPGMPADFPNAPQPSGEPASPFSIKDEGMPNAFSDLIDPRLLRPVRWQIDLGYTMLWFNAGNYPVLATTGNVNNPVAGALGQPGTKVLSGAHEPGMSSAFRTTFTYWLCDPETLAFEGNFFIMEQRSLIEDFNSNVNGSPLLARPYFNVVGRREDADLRAFPGLLRGTMHDQITTRLMGAETNLRWNSSNQLQGSRFNCMVGLRWIRFDERYNSYDTTIDVAGAGPITTVSDAFSAHNLFFGGQVGLDWQYRLQRLTLTLSSKVAVGPNYQNLNISGETVVTDLVANEPMKTLQGLYAQPSNIGEYRVIRTSVVPEFGAKLSLDLTDHLRFNVGYTFTLFTNALRPGDQLDRNINIQVLQAGVPTPPLVPGPPTFRQTTLQTHMLNLGIEFLF